MMYILWETFEIAVNFFQGYIVTYFVYAYLGDRRGKKYTNSHGIAYAIGIAVIISLMNYLMVFEHFYAFIYTAIVFIYTLTSLKGSIITKIFAVVFPTLVMSILSAFGANFAAVLFNTDLNSILSKNNHERCIAIISTQLLITYCIILSLKIMRKSGKGKTDLAANEWIFISMVLLISIIIGAFLNIISLENVSHDGRVYIVLTFAGIIFINVVVCYLVVDLSNKNKAVRENEILRIQHEYSRQYIDNAKIEYDVIRKLTHDYKDNCSVIYTLLSSGNIEKAMRHIEQNIGNLAEKKVFVNTNNDIVNAVINAKLSTAKSLDIDVTCISVLIFEDIDDMDLCRLLSNMLENAVTASVKSQSNNKQIYLKISSDEYKYDFSLKNTIDTSVLEVNPKLCSTKKEIKEHGYGTKIIRDISEKYNGRCDFYEEDGCFCCHVILKKQ